jgi:hypothetical protein
MNPLFQKFKFTTQTKQISNKQPNLSNLPQQQINPIKLELQNSASKNRLKELERWNKLNLPILNQCVVEAANDFTIYTKSRCSNCGFFKYEHIEKDSGSCSQFVPRFTIIIPKYKMVDKRFWKLVEIEIKNRFERRY